MDSQTMARMESVRLSSFAHAQDLGAPRVRS